MRRAALLATALLALALPAVAVAKCPQTTLGDVEDEVMCPVCGTPLELASEAPQAERERALITRLVDDCQTKEQVKARLVAEYGDEVLALPDDEGFDLAAYLVPGPRPPARRRRARRRGSGLAAHPARPRRGRSRRPKPPRPSGSNPTSTATTCDRRRDR